MDLNALHVFYWTAKLGGVGAAARRLQVTQPAVSQRLRGLEESMGKKLYGRAENRFVLTEDGRGLLEACRASFETLDSLHTLMTGQPAELQGTVRIVSLSEFAKARLFPLMREFRDLHPAVRFQMEYRHPYEMVPLLLRNEADMIFNNETPGRPQIECATVFTEEYVFVGPRPKRRFSWEEMARVSWLSCRSEDHYWFEIQRLMAKRGLRVPAATVEVAEVESLMILAAQGLGYAMVPRHAVELRDLSRLAVHEIPFRRIRQAIYGCRLKTLEPGRAASAFWDFVRRDSSRAPRSRGSGGGAAR